MFPVVSINGQINGSALTQISALDRGFTLGDGLFETLRVTNGSPWYLDRHLQRLERGAMQMAIPCPPQIRHWITEVANHAHALGTMDFGVRVTLTRGPMESTGLSLNGVSAPTTTVVAYSLPESIQKNNEQGITVRIASARRNERAMSTRIKTTSYAESILALREAHDSGFDDTIFLNTYDFVAEASAANVFICLNKVIVTPAVTQGILPGITREVVLQLAKDTGFSTAEREVHDEELMNADEVFLTSSLRGLVPVVKVGQHTLGQGTPGLITRQLMKAYEQAPSRV